MSQILFTGTPTAQIDFNYTPSIDEPVVLYFTGSAYSVTVNRMIGFKLFINGQPVATTQVFSNGNETHRTLTPALANYTFPFEESNGAIKPVAIRIEPSTGDTTFDNNDTVTLAIM